VIGPYVIDAAGHVQAVPPRDMEGRLTAAARHLVEPARKAYVYDMEGLLYELDLGSREATRLFARAVPGWHGKGAYSGQGVLVVANNGERAASSASKFEPFDYAVPNTRATQHEAGALAEWDGRHWRLVRRRQFTDVTGPDGVHGSPKDDAGASGVHALGRGLRPLAGRRYAHRATSTRGLSCACGRRDGRLESHHGRSRRSGGDAVFR
jgi:hypothetical protein